MTGERDPFKTIMSIVGSLIVLGVVAIIAGMFQINGRLSTLEALKRDDLATKEYVSDRAERLKERMDGLKNWQVAQGTRHTELEKRVRDLERAID